MTYLNPQVSEGCVSFFTNDVRHQMLSYVTTFCGCNEIGPKRYDLHSLKAAGLITKTFDGMISYIVTGANVAVDVYNSPSFGLEPGDSQYKTAIGPERAVGMSDLEMGPDGNWDDAVYSLIIQSWASCDLPPVPCGPVSTQAPVSEPTPLPETKKQKMFADVHAMSPNNPEWVDDSLEEKVLEEDSSQNRNRRKIRLRSR